MVLMPFVVAAAVLAWDRWVRRRRDPGTAPVRPGAVLALAAIGVATHPTLDWMNTYGMRWALPFDGTWSYGDALFIIDPWIWLVLGGAVFLASDWSRGWLVLWITLAIAAAALVLLGVPDGRLPFTLGLVAIAALRRSGRPATAPARRRIAIAAAGAVCLYVLSLVAGSARAREDVLRAADAAGLQPIDAMVAPIRGNPFVSEVEVLTLTGYVPGVHRWLPEPGTELHLERAVPLVATPPGLDPAKARELIARARAEPDVQDYLTWSRYPYIRIEQDGADFVVIHADARYDAVPEAGSLAAVRVRVPASP